MSRDARLTAIITSLTYLHIDINDFVDASAGQLSAQRRAALVDVHHQLRVLGQCVNTALGPAPAPDAEPAEPT
ncbi:hypothetical protein [Micromonospora peucetia]|uniref:Uncharacterized protein n=1 Tax=Micromonospora peucetia TaxID=47871 RepID=A0A1C6W546_9ACTN|nr:hypothetical protein [Micromonospora peucetia]SCL73652.1 hypothetical protein GA0070608_5962 [Micromonospora peucetia]